MLKKRFTAEQIVTKLRQIEVLMAQGRTAAQACKEADISEHTSPSRSRSSRIYPRETCRA